MDELAEEIEVEKVYTTMAMKRQRHQEIEAYNKARYHLNKACEPPNLKGPYKHMTVSKALAYAKENNIKVEDWVLKHFQEQESTIRYSLQKELGIEPFDQYFEMNELIQQFKVKGKIVD